MMTVMLMLNPVVITPPIEMPVSLELVKQHLRVDHDDDDELIEQYIAAAVGMFDGWNGSLHRCLVSQELEQAYARFSECMEIPLGDVIELIELTYLDSSGDTQTLSINDFQSINRGGKNYLIAPNGYSFPQTLVAVNAIRLKYKAGFGDAAKVPTAIKQAILLTVGHFYENHDATTTERNLKELPLGVERLTNQYRLGRIL